MEGLGHWRKVPPSSVFMGVGCQWRVFREAIEE